MKGLIVVEGHGDIEAAANLVSRLSRDLGLGMIWAAPMRWKNLHQAQGLRRLAEYMRPQRDLTALLVLRDEDDQCPRLRGPEAAAILRDLRLPFPAAVVLFHREFEVLFLPCLSVLAGKRLGSGADERPAIVPGARFSGDVEAIRGVKEWLSGQYPAGKSYKPTLDQAPLTRLLDFDLIRQAQVPCFGTLERALTFLAEGKQGVYPPG